MVLRYLSFLFLFAYLQNAIAQYSPAQLSARAQRQAQQMLDSLRQGYHTGYIGFVHPALAQLAGGHARMKQSLDATRQEMKKRGEQFVAIKAGKAGECVKEKNEWQCVIPQTTVVKTTKGEKTIRSVLIGISADGGKTWRFIDSGGAGKDLLYKVFPGLSKSLVFPA